jgi:hypothetical protein
MEEGFIGAMLTNSVNRPFFYSLSWYTMEFARIIGNNYTVFSQGMSGNHQVHTTNRLASRLKCRTYLRIVVGSI